MTASPTIRLDRRIFATSRLAEFTSKDELTKQTGHPPDQWPLVIVKELVDNAIDEAERVGTAPEIEVEIDRGRITVADNGKGIAPETVTRILDYTVRASSKEAYVSPTRGAQGNALKTILAMPFAMHGTTGQTTIESQGIRHEIVFAIDPIRREPRIDHTTHWQYPPLLVPGRDAGSIADPFVKSGTRITVHLPETPRCQDEVGPSRFLQTLEDFAALNPHLTLKSSEAMPSNTAWTKWRPSDPIPAHWYSADRFDRLLAAHVADDQDHGRTTTVREFIGTFRGMTGTAKQKAVLESTGTSRMSLADFYGEGNNKAGVQQLLMAMRNATKPVKPADLGVIGESHIKAHFERAGANLEDTFSYARQAGETLAGLPFVVETAFAWCPNADERRLITGLNFSPTLSNPFRSVGQWAPSLDQILTSQHAGSDEPVIMLVHLTCPVMAFTDRGKSQLVLDRTVGDAIKKAIAAVTNKWHKLRKQEEREESARWRRREKLARMRRWSVKDAAYEVMEAAWLKASANGTLPANARQVMYAARLKIQEMTGKQLDDKYFTQVLLPDYMLETEADWDVVYDERGHFTEPHGGQEIGLGTLSVRRYLANLKAPLIVDGKFTGTNVEMHGPQGNFGGILYIEKEGFDPLLDQVRLADRFDLALMSCKGMSVTAARTMAERICGERGIPLYILHDCDKSGLSIKSTLHRNTRRYRFRDQVQAIDLGLRLGDVRELGLEDLAEQVFDKGSRDARAQNLRQNGATEDEVQFLLHQRVELNALASDQMVRFVERKLTENGVQKVVPETDVLANAYKSYARSAKLAELIEEVVRRRADTKVTVPDNLADQVKELLRKNATLRWDEAVEAIVADER